MPWNFRRQRYNFNGYWLWVIGYGQGLRINFFIWASQRGLGDDASKRRNAYFFIWASQRGLGDDASKRRNTYAGDSSNR